MNDMGDLKRTYRFDELLNMFWIRISWTIADKFTRTHGNSIVRDAVETWVLNFVFKQSIFKDDGKWMSAIEYCVVDVNTCRMSYKRIFILLIRPRLCVFPLPLELTSIHLSLLTSKSVARLPSQVPCDF